MTVADLNTHIRDNENVLKTTLDNSGKIALSVVSKSANYTAVVTDDVVICSANTFTVTLYAAAGNTGRSIIVKNNGSGTITIDANAAELIDGATTVVISSQYVSYTLVCDGTGWLIA